MNGLNKKGARKQETEDRDKRSEELQIKAIKKQNKEKRNQ